MTISEYVLRRREKQGWRCYHCDEIFHTDAEAAKHFGKRQDHQAACQVDIEQFRALQDQLAKYREEDTDLHREIERLHLEISEKERRAEELGYSRGLRDAKKLKKKLANPPGC